MAGSGGLDGVAVRGGVRIRSFDHFSSGAADSRTSNNARTEFHESAPGRGGLHPSRFHEAILSTCRGMTHGHSWRLLQTWRELSAVVGGGSVARAAHCMGEVTVP